MTIKSSVKKVKRHLVISFSATDFHGYVGKQDNPMVITVEAMKFTIKRVLVDQRSSADILFWMTFKIWDYQIRSYEVIQEAWCGFPETR
jgi:hypothetical protein